jgi:hypothetical protein
MTIGPVSSSEPLAASVASARELIHTELSGAGRFWHVALLLVAGAMTVGIGSLWATESSLPMRTQVAFGTMVLMGLAWVVYATWALMTRRVLLGQHRVVAGRMAVTFTAAFVTGCIVVAVTTGHPAGYSASALGAVMLGGAVWLLVRARRDVARLRARKMELEGGD